MPTATKQLPLLSPVTPQELGELKVYLPALKIVSYKGPGSSGGVSRSLEPVVRQLGAQIHWVALSGLPLGKDSLISGFSFYKPEIPAALAESHSRAVLDYLFPLFHGMPERAHFDEESWRGLRRLSGLMAAECLNLSAASFPTLCWLHDYETALIAPMLSTEAGTITCQFWHVPWPAPEVMGDSPVRREIVEALLANRLIGFHTSEYATNFLNTVKDTLPNAIVDTLKMEIRTRRGITRVVVMPLGLDFPYWQRLARASRPRAAALPKKYSLANQIILGVDRLDYTKGVVEKLNGLEDFLSTFPGWHRRFHYVQLAQPPQASTAEFLGYTEQVAARVERINSRYAIDGWRPILWLDGHYEHADLAAWYQAADVLAVTPVADGLNLIAKEYVASRVDEQGALVLSRKAGCQAELATGALLVDPERPAELARAFAQALAMGVEEKRRRMHAMRHVVGWNQLHDWALGFLRQAISATT